MYPFNLILKSKGSINFIWCLSRTRYTVNGHTVPGHIKVPKMATLFCPKEYSPHSIYILFVFCFLPDHVQRSFIISLRFDLWWNFMLCIDINLFRNQLVVILAFGTIIHIQLSTQTSVSSHLYNLFFTFLAVLHCWRLLAVVYM